MYSNTHKAIKSWYAKHGRKTLPWRNTNNPYHIYLSEIMLQQTQVTTVLERFYSPFLERFPSFESLAQADEADVLKQWQGLGYYQRARNLHQCAKQTAPALPKDVTSLIALPGIGKTTAHAIAAFAYHQNVPILDANVKRLLYRIFAIEVRNEKLLWQKAELLLDHHAPYIYNQALMDIGSTLCKPTKVDCKACPFIEICEGQTNPYLYPQKKVTKKVPTKHKIYLISYNSKKEFITTKREDRLLQGLWRFPEIEEAPEKATYLGEVKHAYSHFKLTAKVYLEKSTFCNGQKLDTITLQPHSKVEEKILLLLREQSHLS